MSGGARPARVPHTPPGSQVRRGIGGSEDSGWLGSPTRTCPRPRDRCGGGGAGAGRVGGSRRSGTGPARRGWCRSQGYVTRGGAGAGPIEGLRQSGAGLARVGGRV